MSSNLERQALILSNLLGGGVGIDQTNGTLLVQVIYYDSKGQPARQDTHRIQISEKPIATQLIDKGELV